MRPSTMTAGRFILQSVTHPMRRLGRTTRGDMSRYGRGGCQEGWWGSLTATDDLNQCVVGGSAAWCHECPCPLLLACQPMVSGRRSSSVCVGGGSGTSGRQAAGSPGAPFEKGAAGCHLDKQRQQYGAARCGHFHLIKNQPTHEKCLIKQTEDTSCFNSAKT